MYCLTCVTHSSGPPVKVKVFDLDQDEMNSLLSENITDVSPFSEALVKEKHIPVRSKEYESIQSAPFDESLQNLVEVCFSH